MEQKIYSAICGVMRGIKAISKDNRNTQQYFNYRSVDDVMNELHTLFAQNNVFIVPEVLEAKKQQQGTSKNGNPIYETIMKVKYTFFTDDGSSIEAVVIGEAMDSGDKGANKALSIAFKYACLQVFCIPTEEDKDPDGHSYTVDKNTTKKEAPKQQQPKKEAPKTAPKLKGGDTTPEQKEYIKQLLQATTEDGAPVFTQAQKTEYLKSRTELTAQELIKKIEDYLGIKNSIQTLYDAPQKEPTAQATNNTKEAPAPTTAPAEAPKQQSFDDMQTVEKEPEPDIF